MYEIMLTSAMYKYYQVYPKLEMKEFAVFYCLEDMADELKIELEIILGIPLKFETKPKKDLDKMLETSESRDFILQ